MLFQNALGLAEILAKEFTRDFSSSAIAAIFLGVSPVLELCNPPDSLDSPVSYFAGAAFHLLGQK